MRLPKILPRCARRVAGEYTVSHYNSRTEFIARQQCTRSKGPRCHGAHLDATRVEGGRAGNRVRPVKVSLALEFGGAGRSRFVFTPQKTSEHLPVNLYDSY